MVFIIEQYHNLLFVNPDLTTDNILFLTGFRCWVSFENNLVWTFVAPILLICFVSARISSSLWIPTFYTLPPPGGGVLPTFGWLGLPPFLSHAHI